MASLRQQLTQAVAASSHEPLSHLHLVGTSLDRGGQCTCGVPVAAHFLPDNRKVSCADAAAIEVAASVGRR